MNLPRVKPDDPITADGFNQLIDAANSCELNVAQGCGLSLQSGPHGYLLGMTINMPFYAKITGTISGGKYPFTQQYPAASGTWTAGSLTGTAYEIGGNTSVTTNTYVKMWRTAAGDYRFLAGSC